MTREKKIDWLRSLPSEKCPVCGQRCEELYVDRESGVAYGCPGCIKKMDVWDWMEECREELK